MTSSADGGLLQSSRPVRFAASYDGPSRAKNRRITAACGTCRRRKTRCDGTRPECLACKENKTPCMGYKITEKSSPGPVHVGSVSSKEWRNSRDEQVPAPRQHRASSTTEGATMTTRDDAKNSGSPDFAHAILDHVDSDAMPSRSGRSIPYFRYFGPTAIVPGFKQMVVKVKEQRGSIGSTSAVSIASPVRRRLSNSTTEPHSTANTPLYDCDDSVPLHPLIKHLVETFFIHLGCNFPFLRRDSFLRRLEGKTVETILVDAICALAARFSTHPLLAIPKSPEDSDLKHPESDYGIVFAHRARSAVVDSFPCPTVVSVQACLLLAYEGFGTNQDSALWMYLGCAIRMAQDLGLQKQEGIKHLVQQELDQTALQNERAVSPPSQDPRDVLDEEKALVQSYLNTYWAVLMLDRVISSGTGRPVTLRDQDMDVSFPPYDFDAVTEWPVPFPALIRVIHIYGRVSDLLNNIRHADDLNPDAVKRLDEMEQDLTNLYQKLDPRLNFHVVNFQHYAKAGQGTNFILLHFWFHTLIIILHQPTLLHSFEGSIQQLFPNSRELSMSSAKTIADILAFAELTDAKSFVNNPFTSQPMYVAASAFLMEIRAQSGSLPASRSPSPSARVEKAASSAPKVSRKHGLLASAAKDNYQRCYKALQQLERYWAGTKYILTALDQKAQGIWDKESLETYTAEEMEHAKRQKAAISGASPASTSNLSKLSPGAMDGHSRGKKRKERPEPDESGPKPFPTMNDIGSGQMWTLNGNTNSRNANLTFLYQNSHGEPSRGLFSKQNTLADPSTHPAKRSQVQQHYQRMTVSTSNSFPTVALSAASPTSTILNANNWTVSNDSVPRQLPIEQSNISSNAMDGLSVYLPPSSNLNYDFFQLGNSSDVGGDMTIESQDVDIPLDGDMMNWLEYLPSYAMGGGENGSVDGGGGT